jgi:hypothetical protein
MEKRGDLLNQLAIITDLVEKINANVKSSTLVFEVSKVEFERIFQLVENKYGKRSEVPKNTFNLTIGEVDIIFNTNNV